jgi:hypothetical protein
MKTKIGVYGGYDLWYDSVSKQFLAFEGHDEITSSVSQDALERKLKSMNKTNFKRILIITIGSYGYDKNKIVTGEITSVNHEDRQMWYIMAGRRSKTGIGYRGFSPDTPENRAIAEQAIAKYEEAKRAGKEGRELEETMTKIDYAYLGVTE